MLFITRHALHINGFPAKQDSDDVRSLHERSHAPTAPKKPGLGDSSLASALMYAVRMESSGNFGSQYLQQARVVKSSVLFINQNAEGHCRALNRIKAEKDSSSGRMAGMIAVLVPFDVVCQILSQPLRDGVSTYRGTAGVTEGSRQ